MASGASETVVDRVRSLEDYKSSHEGQVMAYWNNQWRTNADVEKRVRVLEQFSQRLVGAVGFASIIGSGVGAAFATWILKP